jgi:hypothetical protein
MIYEYEFYVGCVVINGQKQTAVILFPFNIRVNSEMTPYESRFEYKSYRRIRGK